MKLIQAGSWRCQGHAPISMASADTEELRSTYRVSRRSTEGGNPGKYSSESPEGEEDRQDDP